MSPYKVIISSYNSVFGNNLFCIYLTTAFLLGAEAIGVSLCGVCLLGILQRGHVGTVSDTVSRYLRGLGGSWKGDGLQRGSGEAARGGARRVWQLRDTSAQLAAGSYWGQRMGARNVATVWSESGSSAKLFRQHPDTYTTHRLTNKLYTEKKINKKNANYWTWT